MRKYLISSALLLSLSTTSVMGETDPFASGWSVDQSASTINFVSVKKGSVMELSRFSTLAGGIAEDGTVTVRIPLDGVDTGIDLRNVRMRFLFFESFNYPEATVTATITPDMLSDLEEVGTKSVTMDLDLNLNGMTQALSTEMLVTLIDNDRVVISSVSPIILQVADFGLTQGLAKLEEAAEVTIVPATVVTYNFAFDRNETTETTDVADPVLASVALEPEGNLSKEACIGRFEILSRSGNINFENNSATLTPSSRPILGEVLSIATRCPDMTIQVNGHTDSVGAAEYNLYLSELRSSAVVDYLVNAGLPSDRVVNSGFGEALPIASNGTAQGRERNRRIEFEVLGFDENQG